MVLLDDESLSLSWPAVYDDNGKRELLRYVVSLVYCDGPDPRRVLKLR